jgi:protein SCO1
MLNKSGRDKVSITILVTAMLLAAYGAAAHDRQLKAWDSQIPSGALADITLFDMQLVDQDGKPVKFKSDAIADKVVVIEFFYTSCTTICPVTTTLLTQAQRGLGDRFGRDVRFVSITVDPTTDTPQRLKTYATRHQAPPGWLWLTGQKPLVDKVLTGLGAYTADFVDHPSMIVVGDGRSGEWTRFYGFPAPEQILAKVNALLAARNTSAAPASTPVQE